MFSQALQMIDIYITYQNILKNNTSHYFINLKFLFYNQMIVVNITILLEGHTLLVTSILFLFLFVILYQRLELKIK